MPGLILAAILIQIGPVSAKAHSPRPLLELGVGGGGGSVPDYPGSDQSRLQGIAFPVFYYHGRIFRSDREDGARARVVNKPVVAVDVTGSGAFPVDSEDNRARQGMPALQWLGEFGPRLFVRLEDSRHQMWRAFTFVRPAFTTNFKKGQGRGLVAGLGAAYERRQLIWAPISYYSRLTPQFASKEYHDYFYTVDSRYATPGRPEYHARGGYLGTWWTNGLVYEREHFVATMGFSLVSTRGAANTESPLFRDDLNVSIFLGLAWFFYQSDEPGYM